MAKRILVVEDNDLNRKLFCDVLRSQGYAVEPVADGNLALDRAREFVPNLIIMDIQLAAVSGLDLIEESRRDAVLRQIPVLAVTAYAGKGDEERIRDVGRKGICPSRCRSARSWPQCGHWWSGIENHPNQYPACSTTNVIIVRHKAAMNTR